MCAARRHVGGMGVIRLTMKENSMKIRTYLKDGERYGLLDNGLVVGPLGGGARNVHAGRTEYIFEEKVYYEPIREPKEEDPEPQGEFF